MRRQKSTETSPRKDLITYILDKKFKMTVRDAESTKGRGRESQENNVITK